MLEDINGLDQANHDGRDDELAPYYADLADLGIFPDA